METTPHNPAPGAPPSAFLTSPSESSRRDQITVVVFKDNLASRSFRVPLNWISRFGSLLFLSLAVCVFSILFAVKYYRTAHRGDPGRISSLEQEISELKGANGDLRAKLEKAIAAPIAANPAKETAPVPIPTVTVTATPVTTAVAAPPPPGAGFLFSDLPAGVSRVTAAIPIAIQVPKISWKNRTLLVNFALEYKANDGGNQQGRIVILARGPETIEAYPDGVFSTNDGAPLIRPESGEYFSVSRYRETHAEFAVGRSGALFNEVEILIFGHADEGKQPPLLLHERLPVEGKAAAAPEPKARIAPKPKPTEAPKEDSEPAEGSPAPTQAAPATGAALPPNSAPPAPSEATPPAAAGAPTQETPAQ